MLKQTFALCAVVMCLTSAAFAAPAKAPAQKPAN